MRFKTWALILQYLYVSRFFLLQRVAADLF